MAKNEVIEDISTDLKYFIKSIVPNSKYKNTELDTNEETNSDGYLSNISKDLKYFIKCIVPNSVYKDGSNPVPGSGGDSGEEVIANDSSYLYSLVVDGKAVQDGTPTVENPKSIKTVKSINLFDEPNEGYMSGGAETYQTYYAGAGGTALIAKIEPNESYTIKTYYKSDMNRFRVVLFDTDPRLHSGEQYTSGHYSQLINKTTITGDEVYTFNSGMFTWVALGVSTSSTPYNKNIEAQIEKGLIATPYIPYGSIGLKIGSEIMPIDLQGNVLASLPDDTKDVLTVDSVGHCVVSNNVSHIASYNGESVDNVYMSTTGQLTTGAEIYYKASNTSTIDLGYIDIPQIPDGSEISIVAQVTPNIDVEWWTINQDATARAISTVMDEIKATETNVLNNIAKVENGTASANYSVGSYLINNGKLYKVTSAIASGENIVPGTNVTATTVMAELVALTS